jgi:putative acetyltransferase
VITVAQESPLQPEVALLLRLSDAQAQALYPPASNHLLPGDALARPNVRFFVARRAGRAIGCAALVLGTAGAAELKRMFVDPARRSRGIGRTLLQAIERAAYREDVRVIQLETGIYSHEALALYRRGGYRERPPFGAYVEDPLSVFMEKTLD